MKRLVVTILLVILAMSPAGCTVVREHYHGHVRHAVFVPRPPHVIIRPAPAPHRDAHRPPAGRAHPGPRPMPPRH